MRYADLHTHTYHSDGTRSPREVIDVAKRHGIEILSISDHDNIAAYFEAKPYADQQGILLVPGIELSCAYDNVDVHILAYAFDPLDPRIETRLRSFRETRHRRGLLIVERLRELGVPVRPERVEELAAGAAMGRPHVARALVEAGHVKSVSEAFDRFLGTGKPANVEKQRFRIDEANTLIHAAGGVTSLAHPTLYPNHAALAVHVLESGVDGIEVLHPDVDADHRERYSALAMSLHKMTTGGSDDHGKVKKVETLGTIKVPESMLGPILERMSA